MQATIRDGLQVSRGAHGMLVIEQNALPPSVRKQIDELKASVDETSTAAREQEAHHAGFSDASDKAQDLKRRVRETGIHPIIAFVELGMAEDEELRRTLSIGKVRSYEEVIVVGRNLADYFEANKARFIEAGFAEDTGVQLQSAVTELEATLVEKSEHHARRRKATVTLKESFRRTKRRMRFIDRLLRSHWARSPEKYAMWRSTSKFPKVRNGNGHGGGTASETPAPDGHSSSERHAS